MIEITPIKAFKDNYIWCLHQQGSCVLVDPGDATVVLSHLSRHSLHPTDILVTHHHPDHIGGIGALLNHFPALRVWGAQSPRIAGVNRAVRAGQHIDLPSLNLSLEVLALPGHTLDHMGFYAPEVGLFCGDTLFSAGCGRLFEGTPTQMFNSLNTLKALPDETRVYCAHEYTLANLKFAQEVEPDNAELQQYTKWAQARRQQDLPTLPSSIGLEKAVNPFLRVHSPSIIARVAQRIGTTPHTPVAIFAALRGWKDQF